MAAPTENDSRGGGSNLSSIRVPFLNLHPNDPRNGKNMSPSLIPRSDFERAYGPSQALHIRGFVPPPPVASSSSLTCGGGADGFRASDVRPLFDSINDEDKASWCIENDAIRAHGVEGARLTPSEFLDISNTSQRGYCSFLVQHSKVEMEGLLANRLPMVHLPVADGSGDMMKVNYGPCLWLFFGKNYAGEDASPTLPGRPEHTDSVTHDGTWHYQLSGTKIWRLRPTTKLLQMMEEHKRKQKEERPVSGAKRKIDDAAYGACDVKEVEANNANPNDARETHIEVECRQGDVLFLNTRLWWHSTLIPPQDAPSISYARDVYFPNSEASPDPARDADTKDNVDNGAGDGGEEVMTNVDGTYATEDIAAETVLFTERTMPNCELHRSKTDPNCQLVELEDDAGGESYMAIVTLRDIKEGEFFSILESDEEEESDSGEEDGIWEEDEDEEKYRCIIVPR
jgi:U3 small nucleolar RNA-associated protein 6